jgi:hypothetical protein
MRLYSGKINVIVDDILRELTANGAVEVEDENEARLDLESVFKEYLRADRSIAEEARNRLEARGLGYSNLGRTRAQVAKERGVASGEDVLPYLLDQLLTMLFHSSHVAEVFASDADIRRTLTAVLRRHMDVEDELDAQVRSHIKNLEEGTASFEIEYKRVMEEMKRKKGLT